MLQVSNIFALAGVSCSRSHLRQATFFCCCHSNVKFHSLNTIAPGPLCKLAQIKFVFQIGLSTMQNGVVINFVQIFGSFVNNPLRRQGWIKKKTFLYELSMSNYNLQVLTRHIKDCVSPWWVLCKVLLLATIKVRCATDCTTWTGRTGWRGTVMGW